MRLFALLGAVVSFALAACRLTANQAPVTPGWPEESPLGCPARLVDDAGFVTTVSQCVLDGHSYCGRSPCDAGHE